MKLFELRGGVHPEGRKDLSAARHIRTVPLPKDYSFHCSSTSAHLLHRW